MTAAFQSNAFQNNAFQVSDAVVATTSIDVGGKARPGVKHRGYRAADDELSEGEVQFMFRKIAELKRAKTEREQETAAKELEIALAQASKDDAAAQVISTAIDESKKLRATGDYSAVMRDIALLTQIAKQLDHLVKQVSLKRRSLDDEDVAEILLLAMQ